MRHHVGDVLEVAAGGLFCCCVSKRQCPQLTARPPTHHSLIPPMHPHKTFFHPSHPLEEIPIFTEKQHIL